MADTYEREENARESARRGNAVRTSAEAAQARATETLDMVSLSVIEQCDALIAELTGIKEYMIQDCGRVKAEVAQHVNTAGQMKDTTASVKKFVESLKEKRADIIRARIE